LASNDVNDKAGIMAIMQKTISWQNKQGDGFFII
jgi:hypothetical protein